MSSATSPATLLKIQPPLAIPPDLVVTMFTNHVFMGALLLSQIKALCQGLHRRPKWPAKAIIGSFVMVMTTLTLQGSWAFLITSTPAHIDIHISIVASLCRFTAVLLLAALSACRAMHVLHVQSLMQTLTNRYQLGIQTYMLIAAVCVATLVQLLVDLSYLVSALNNRRAWVDQRIDWSFHTLVSTMTAFISMVYVCFSEGYVSLVIVACNPFDIKDGVLHPARPRSNDTPYDNDTWDAPFSSTVPFNKYTPGSRAYCSAVTMARFRLIRAGFVSIAFIAHFIVLLVSALNLSSTKVSRVFAPLDIASWAMVLCRILEFGEEFNVPDNHINPHLSSTMSDDQFDPDDRPEHRL